MPTANESATKIPAAARAAAGTSPAATRERWATMLSTAGSRIIRAARAAFRSIDRRVHQIGDAVEPRAVPRVGLHVVGDVGERDAACRVGPGIGRAGAAMAKRLPGAERAKPADALAVA